MALFLHCQQRELRLSPQMRKLIKKHLPLVDKSFRYSKENRETFRAILESKGQVATSLRQMHRVGFLELTCPSSGLWTVSFNTSSSTDTQQTNTPSGVLTN